MGTMAVNRPRIDASLAPVDEWLARHSVTVLRWSLGAVFLIFGFLKFFPGASPAEDVATETTALLTFGVVDHAPALFGVALLECTIGLSLLTGRFLGLGLGLLAAAFVGILSPLVLLADQLFTGPAHAPNLLGQYVIKDVVLVAAGLVVAARARSAATAPAPVDPSAAEVEDLPPRRKMEIVLTSLHGRRSVSAVCAEHRVPEEAFLRWRDQLVDGAARTLVACERDGTARELLRERVAAASPAAAPVR